MHRRIPILLFLTLIFALTGALQAQTFDLTGDQENPPVMTDRTGSCVGQLDVFNTQYTLACQHDVTDVVAAHIHNAPTGVNGPITFFLDFNTTIAATVSQSTIDAQINDGMSLALTSFEDFLRELRAGNLYVNVHSPANPGGELRGQIPPPPNPLFFAQLGDGGGLTSDIVLLNTSSTGDPVVATITFYGPDGNLLDLGIDGMPTSSVDVMLDPLSSTTISTDGTTDPIGVGSAKVESDGPLGGVIRFNISINDNGIAGVTSSAPLTKAIVPARRVANGVNTGIACRNTDGAPITLALSLRQGGMEVANGSASVDVAVNGRVAMFIDQLFDMADTDDFTGTVKISVESGSFACTGLEQGPGPGEFTTLPVLPITGSAGH